MNKYLKVMFGTSSGANNNLKYKIDEINISNNWNPSAQDPKKELQVYEEVIKILNKIKD